MSWLGILTNVAKVGVGLLNGVLNGPATTSSFDERAKANPDLYYADSDGNRFIMVSKYVMDHPDETKLGEQATASAVEDGEVSVALVEGPDGKQRIHCINHTRSPYLMSFNTTSGLGNVRIKPAVVPSIMDTRGNVVDVTDQFTANEGGNMTSTRMQNNDSEPTPGTLMLPPLSTVLSNVGLVSIVATALVSLWSAKSLSLTLAWKTDAGENIIGFSLKNDTNVQLNVTAQLNWSNPANESTYNASVPPRTTVNVPIDNATSPVDSASVAVFSNDVSTSQRQEIYESMMDIARQQHNMFLVRAKVGGRTPSGGNCNTSALSDDEKQRLARITPTLKKLGNSSPSELFNTSMVNLINKAGGVPAAIRVGEKVKHRKGFF